VADKGPAMRMGEEFSGDIRHSSASYR
jgi:hypothetical protein